MDSVMEVYSSHSLTGAPSFKVNIDYTGAKGGCADALFWMIAICRLQQTEVEWSPDIRSPFHSPNAVIVVPLPLVVRRYQR